MCNIMCGCSISYQTLLLFVNTDRVRYYKQAVWTLNPVWCVMVVLQICVDLVLGLCHLLWVGLYCLSMFDVIYCLSMYDVNDATMLEYFCHLIAI